MRVSHFWRKKKRGKTKGKLWSPFSPSNLERCTLKHLRNCSNKDNSVWIWILLFDKNLSLMTQWCLVLFERGHSQAWLTCPETMHKSHQSRHYFKLSFKIDFDRNVFFLLENTFRELLFPRFCFCERLMSELVHLTFVLWKSVIWGMHKKKKKKKAFGNRSPAAADKTQQRP